MCRGEFLPVACDVCSGTYHIGGVVCGGKTYAAIRYDYDYSKSMVGLFAVRNTHFLPYFFNDYAVADDWNNYTKAAFTRAIRRIKL